MSQRGTVQLVHLNGFSAGGRVSGTDEKNHTPYLAPVPLSRYIEPEDIGSIKQALTSIARKEILNKSRADIRLAGPHWMHNTSKESIWDKET